jgi:hypothetical protein
MVDETTDVRLASRERASRLPSPGYSCRLRLRDSVGGAVVAVVLCS